MNTKIEEIIECKKNVGEEAFLWLQEDVGDCILWPSQKLSVDDDGSNAVARWKLTEREVNDLQELVEIEGWN